MTHAVPRPRTTSTRASTARPRHPANPGRPSTNGAERLLSPPAAPDGPQELPKRTPGVALDAVHEESVIPLRHLDGSANNKSERWFTPHRQPEEQEADTLSRSSEV